MKNSSKMRQIFAEVRSCVYNPRRYTDLFLFFTI